jgi:hypothetical protein
LLEQFVEAMAVQRAALIELSRATKSGDSDRLSDAVRVVKDLSGIVNSTAVKLRITVQSTIDRKSAQRHETEPSLGQGRHLLGGGPRTTN